MSLARAGKSLPWIRADDALRERGLIQPYSDPFDNRFAELNGKGQAVAHVL